MQVILLAILLIGIAIAGFAVKMFLKPGGTFTKTCGSNFHPETGEPMPCSCSSDSPEDCESNKIPMSEIKINRETPEA